MSGAGWSEHRETIRDGLRSAIAELAEALLGPANLKASNQRVLKFGRHGGSLHVAVTGPKRGLWYDHGGNGSGDAISLVRHIRGGTIDDAFAWSAGWLGVNIADPAPEIDPVIAAEREAERQRRQDEANAAKAQDDARRLAGARWLAAQSKPLAGTAGATYLAGRGIQVPEADWPPCVRWLDVSLATIVEAGDAGHEIRRTLSCAGALIMIATNAVGTIYAVQLVYIGKDGRNLRDASGAKVKKTRGILRGTGAMVRLPGDPARPLLLAEGPETGLAIWTATNHETWIALGSIGNNVPPAGRIVVACRDDDAVQAPADKKLIRYPVGMASERSGYPGCYAMAGPPR